MISKFGSHKSMVDRAATAALENPDMVVCRDQFGLYVTKAKALDNGLADHNRFNSSRMARYATADKEWVHG
jgi:hypothetical protein